MKNTGTSGGNRLRALREYCGKTQLEVELDASLGIGYLQRVESGKVRYPERETLERILSALEAHYTERRDILELFGYVVDTPLPDEREIQHAIRLCQVELESAIFPVYLLDCGHRLLAWNRFIPRLFHSDQPPFPHYLTSILRALFDPRYPLPALIANPSEFFPAQMRALRYEMRLFRGESWYSPLIENLKAECPQFEKYWTESLHENVYIAARPLVPINLNISAIGSLCFRLTSEPFAQDRRFRIIYYIPADSVTIQHCLTGF